MAKKPIRTVSDVPTFNLRDLPPRQFSKWQYWAEFEVVETRANLSEWLPEIERSQTPNVAPIHYVLLAYEMAAEWEQHGETQKMIFNATYVTNPLKFRENVDIFSAVLLLVAAGTERIKSLSFVDLGSRACKLAWVNRWSASRFEYELLCDGIDGLAKRWTEIAEAAAPDPSPAASHDQTQTLH